ncbi:hypothetical protein DFW101_1596 [Solidesulfovibrio carbinoliphilus subsp. oakridgensis]|uniref:Membrane-bound metal-dependent hydrolase n=1 Tax=Solidesulfovibrio carbinoliphilus subsp. oakridgensis TaxID=694327 RepID=G7Q6J1_9BACT|nr:hypothetical protein [Solidesulfovibrio carbinoliphilus]EHJ47604.1 hypothetical protein DFW101_1596 [Solidesulfovibrio carbinoliphilus subsp. oakridgensis]
MILGHAGLAVLARRTAFSTVSLVPLLAAAYGPDLIDKMGMVFWGTSGKFVGHSLAVFAAVAGLLALWLRLFRPGPAAQTGRAGRLWWALTLLWLSHLLFDLTEPVVLFWPFLGPLPPPDPYALGSGLVAFYTGRGDLAVLALDLLCLGAALAAVLRPRRTADVRSG